MRTSWTTSAAAGRPQPAPAFGLRRRGSICSLREQTLPAKIQSLLDQWKVEPRFLKIEMTESGAVSDPAHPLAIMAMLQSMGLRLSLDDFGTTRRSRICSPACLFTP